jgi:hypothetical protein
MLKGLKLKSKAANQGRDDKQDENYESSTN